MNVGKYIQIYSEDFKLNSNTMELNAGVVVISHLSDAQTEMSMGMNESANVHIQFVKYLILILNENLNQKINPDKHWNDFDKKYLSKQNPKQNIEIIP